MPNWVKNIVRFHCSDKKLSQIKEYLRSDDYVFDFNKLIPMPSPLQIESGGMVDVAKSCAIAKREGLNTCSAYRNGAYREKSFEKWAELGERYLSNELLYGAPTWYEWCVAHWGTKWNASESKWEDKNTLTFLTAWSMPGPIYYQLKSVFPNVSFEVDYADEDIGCNCGQLFYDPQNKDLRHFTKYNDSDFAYSVWGENEEDSFPENEIENAEGV